ncbi:MAG: hypothetical protein Q4F72_08520 [Desulfovibrionaceae bacterium]|nr:hypothetical protein [Desulfovibrionaceae bacterium]
MELLDTLRRALFNGVVFNSEYSNVIVLMLVTSIAGALFALLRWGLRSCPRLMAGLVLLGALAGLGSLAVSWILS